MSTVNGNKPAMDWKPELNWVWNNRLAWSRSYKTIADPLRRRKGIGMNIHLN